MRTMIVIRVLVVLSACAGILYALNFLMNETEPDRGLPYFSTISEFEFQTQDTIPFGSDDFVGKITVVDFMFTRCKGPCPIMTNYMGTLYKHFDNNDTVQFVSISVDPNHDTFEVLKNYANTQGVDDNHWLFLSAPIDNVIQVCEGSFKLAAEDLPGAHSTKFVLVDRDGKIRGYYSGIEEESIQLLQKDIEELL